MTSITEPPGDSNQGLYRYIIWIYSPRFTNFTCDNDLNAVKVAQQQKLRFEIQQKKKTHKTKLPHPGLNIFDL